MKPDCIVTDVTQVDFANPLSHKADGALFIGTAATEYISATPDINLPKFYANVKNYYIAAIRYMLKRFPFNDSLLLQAEVADPKLRLHKDFTSVRYFTERFPVLVKKADMDKLEGQFLNYQVDDCSGAPSDRVDVFWCHMSKQTNENGQLQFDLLAGVMLAILTIFHSNADSERIFSVVTKNKNKFRPNLSTAVLSSIITHKMCLHSSGNVCHNTNISKDILIKAKQATAA